MSEEARVELAQVLWDATRAQDPEHFMPTVMTDLGSCLHVADKVLDAGYRQASRPFTEEDVEAAAESLAETQEGPGRWDMWDEDFREMSGLRLDARAALDAVTARHTKGDGNV